MGLVWDDLQASSQCFPRNLQTQTVARALGAMQARTHLFYGPSVILVPEMRIVQSEGISDELLAEVKP